MGFGVWDWGLGFRVRSSNQKVVKGLASSGRSPQLHKYGYKDLCSTLGQGFGPGSCKVEDTTGRDPIEATPSAVVSHQRSDTQ